MKKIILIFLFSIFSLNINAQSHLQFMGIEIDGALSSFTQKLSSKGFIKKCNVGDGAVMTGTFTGKPVDVYIFVTAKSKKS